MERSMGSLPGEWIKTCWKAYWKCFCWGVDCIFSFHLPGFIQGRVLCANIYLYFIIRSVLELSVLQNVLNNCVGFSMMDVLNFLLYLVCLLEGKKKKVISSCFIRGPGCFFSQLSSVFLLSCSFYNYWVVQCSRMLFVDSCQDTCWQLIGMSDSFKQPLNLTALHLFLWQHGSTWNSLF